MRNAPLSPAALEVLGTATVTSTSVVLNSGQLDRKVYEEVNKALTRIGGGGQWSRRQRCHLFTRDPGPDLDILLSTGRMPDDADKLLCYFQTPEHVADRMVELVRIEADDRVLEPSAGGGRIASAVYRAHPSQVMLRCVEVDVHRAGELRMMGFSVYQGRFQDYAASDCGKFDAILMNPPFTEPGDPLAWLTHVELAATLLCPGGRLVAIVPASLTFRTGRRFDAIRELVGDDYDELPAGTFKDAGTGVDTVLIEIRGADRPALMSSATETLW